MLGERLRIAREAVGLRQQDASQSLGIEKSGISDIERGQRELKASQLARLAKLYRRPIDFFFSETPPREGVVLWRCRPGDKKNEAMLRREFLSRCEDYCRLEKLTRQRRPGGLPSDLIDKSANEFNYPDAKLLAFKLYENYFSGANAPSDMLRYLLEERFGIRIFAASMGDYGSAICLKDESLGTCIMLNKDNVHWRRNYDLAHELFHLLTWNVFSQGDEVTSKEEKFAETFASVLLLPEAPFKGRILEMASENGVATEHIHEIAREFDVSVAAVVYRLAGLCKWKKPKTTEVLAKVKQLTMPREKETIEELPSRYVQMVQIAYHKGLISMQRAAKYLRVSLKKALDILGDQVEREDIEHTFSVNLD